MQFSLFAHLVASIDCSPVMDSLLMNSILVAVGTSCFSFCNPSRGPTSTILTEFSFGTAAV